MLKIATPHLVGRRQRLENSHTALESPLQRETHFPFHHFSSHGNSFFFFFTEFDCVNKSKGGLVDFVGSKKILKNKEDQIL